MFKASIGLVVLAFITLSYGWVKGIDPLLYGSIGFSALAGVALLRSTLADRRKHPELSRKGRRGPQRSPEGRPKEAVLRERDRKSLAELRSELSEFRGDLDAADLQDAYGAPKRKPLRPFGDSPSGPDERDFDARRPPGPDRFREGDGALRDQERTMEQRSGRPQRPPASSPAESDDFRSRLSAVLGEVGQSETGLQQQARRSDDDYYQQRPSRRSEGGAGQAGRRPEGGPGQQAGRRPEYGYDPPRQGRRPESDFDQEGSRQSAQADAFFEDDEIGSDWIRIEDVPRIARATQQGGGYARPELPPLQPPKRRTPPPPSAPKKAPAKRPTGARPATPRASKAAPRPESGDPSRPPRSRPKPKA